MIRCARCGREGVSGFKSEVDWTVCSAEKACSDRLRRRVTIAPYEVMRERQIVNAYGDGLGDRLVLELEGGLRLEADVRHDGSGGAHLNWSLELVDD